MKNLLLICFSIIGLFGTSQTIQEIQGSAASSPLLGSSVTTSGIVTGKHSLGFFIQNGTGMWSGLYIYNNVYQVEIGDLVEVTGAVEEYFGMTELINVSNVTISSSNNPVPAPELLTTGSAGAEEWESVLVRVESAICNQPNAGFGEYFVNDGSGDLKCDDLLYVFVPTIATTYNLTGPIYYSFSEYKLVPRDASDIENAEPLYFTVEPEEFDMTASSLTIRWETNVPSNSAVFYGLTPTYEIGVVADEDFTTVHELVIEELEAATSYYVQVISEDGEFTTPNFEFIASTASPTEGNIQVWFNHAVNTEVAFVGNEAVVATNITDTIISILLTATETLDITMYDLEGVPPVLMTTLNDLHAAGVDIRFITDIDLANTAFELLDSEISVLAGNSEGIMHDKFIVADAGLSTAWTMTGSMNWTWANLGWDYNNVILIQDQAVARTYEREFEEMWGSASLSYDIQNSRFGSQKTNNTAHKFTIGGIPVEVYFSPTDGTTAQIRERIEEAQTELAIAMMVFTENSLGSAIIDADAAGITVQGIIDYTQFNGSEFDPLVAAGVEVVAYSNQDGTEWPDGPVLHHKYMIADYSAGSEQPVLVTGSHNWSASAESINDENTLIVYDANLANQFYQEYTKRYQDLTIGITERITGEELRVYPNPTTEFLTVSISEPGTLRVMNISGQLVMTAAVTGPGTIDVRHLPQGVYMVILEQQDRTTTARFVKQ
ncbi:MAG: T9SS type A sorting domain-containing protein [Cryomorphaceae bacterium]|nr:T9SS type A sorting domain-containing protein [Cryomorphaceae bacterium]